MQVDRRSLRWDSGGWFGEGLSVGDIVETENFAGQPKTRVVFEMNGCGKGFAVAVLDEWIVPVGMAESGNATVVEHSELPGVIELDADACSGFLGSKKTATVTDTVDSEKMPYAPALMHTEASVGAHMDLPPVN